MVPSSDADRPAGGLSADAGPDDRDLQGAESAVVAGSGIAAPAPREDAAAAPAKDAPSGRRDVLSKSRAASLSHAPAPDALGRTARVPTDIPLRGWKQVAIRTVQEMITDRVALMAAGCAFFATLALFPAISMLISIYGLVFDPSTVVPQLDVLSTLLPPAAFQLIAARVHVLVSQRPGALSVSLLVSTLVTFWSAASGMKGLLAALNQAYEERESRGMMAYQMTAFGMTLAAFVAAVVVLGLLLGLPYALELLGFTSHQKLLLRIAGYVVLIGFVLVALSLLYRFGPARRPARWHWVTPGSIVATVLWLAASEIFSFLVGHVMNYDATYGPIAAVAGVMMWFYVTGYAVLLGAELNAELELQTARDSTAGGSRPIGRRGAYVADHVAGTERGG